MIVDDDPELAEGLAEFLSANGYQVEIAADGREAVDKARSQDFDIAFMDVRMPVMNGVDSFFEIRKLKPQAKIVMMTGFKEPILQKAIEAGAIGPLHKPFNPNKMIDLINTLH
jgi:DNA-binding response OmpR family regulator